MNASNRSAQCNWCVGVRWLSRGLGLVPWVGILATDGVVEYEDFCGTSAKLTIRRCGQGALQDLTPSSRVLQSPDNKCS
jgi:hypothetical protein